jgi:hypothetical protein
MKGLEIAALMGQSQSLCRSLAQLVRASVSKTEGREFDPHNSCQFPFFKSALPLF